MFSTTPFFLFSGSSGWLNWFQYYILLHFSAFLFISCWQLCFASRSRLVDLWKKSCYLFKKLLNVGSCLRTDLFKKNLVILSSLLSLCLTDISILQIDFISQQCYYDSFSSLIFDIVNPFLHTFESISISYVVNYHCNWCISDVVWYECFETLLAGSIPKLQANRFILQKNVLRDKIDSDGGSLSCDECTCSLPSKIS